MAASELDPLCVSTVHTLVHMQDCQGWQLGLIAEALLKFVGRTCMRESNGRGCQIFSRVLQIGRKQAQFIGQGSGIDEEVRSAIAS